MANYTLSATIHLAGPQTVQVDTHGDHRQAGGHLLVSISGVLIAFYVQAAALLWAEAFLAEASIRARRLPARIESGLRPANIFGHPVTLSTTGQRHDVYDFVPGDWDKLVIRVGQITWAFHDQAAYDDIAAGWSKVRQLATLVLPKD